MSTKLTGCPCTAQMDKCKVDWLGVEAVVNHAIHLLETEGATAIHLAKTIMAGVEALSGGNFTGIFLAFNAAVPDVKEIIAAIKLEFAI